MNTYRTAADFVTIEHNVIRIGQCVARIRIETVFPFGLGRSESVVNRRPSPRPHGDVVRLASRLKERGVNYPHKRPLVVLNHSDAVGDLDARRSEQRARGLDLTSGKEDAVPRLGADFCSQARPLWFA